MLFLSSESQQSTLLCSKAWFDLNLNGIMKSSDSMRFWLFVKTLITTEYKNVTKIGSDLHPKRILSSILTNLLAVN